MCKERTPNQSSLESRREPEENIEEEYPLNEAREDHQIGARREAVEDIEDEYVSSNGAQADHSAPQVETSRIPVENEYESSADTSGIGSSEVRKQLLY